MNSSLGPESYQESHKEVILMIQNKIMLNLLDSLQNGNTAYKRNHDTENTEITARFTKCSKFVPVICWPKGILGKEWLEDQSRDKKSEALAKRRFGSDRDLRQWEMVPFLYLRLTWSLTTALENVIRTAAPVEFKCIFNIF